MEKHPSKTVSLRRGPSVIDPTLGSRLSCAYRPVAAAPLALPGGGPAWFTAKPHSFPSLDSPLMELLGTHLISFLHLAYFLEGRGVVRGELLPALGLVPAVVDKYLTGRGSATNLV